MEEIVLNTIEKYNLINNGDKIVVAVSGGPDSMCLLNVLKNIREKFNLELFVAHINHMIREEADSETEYVKQYCEKNNIVSEFVRFHPIINNALDFKKIYDVVYMRKTLGTNLEKYNDPIQEEFSKSCRKNIRQCKNKGITVVVTEAPKDISKIKEIYYSTMKRNNATDYYYFKDEYFNKILQYFPQNILTVEAIYEGKTIAMGLYFIYNQILHIHLSGTLTEYLYLSPAYMLRYGATLWAKEHGYKLIHHGGGRSNSLEDSLYLFKKNFARNTEFDFYIGKKIWNEKIYNKLCEEKHIDPEKIDFFPAYRKEI